MKRKMLIGKIVAFIIGVGILLFSIPHLINTITFVQSASVVEGEVVKLYGNDTQGAVVSYEVAGRKYEVRSSVKSSPPSYKKGEVVEVFFNPDNPEDAKLNSWTELYLLGPVFIVFGFLLLLPIFFWHRRKRLVQHLHQSGRRITAEVTDVISSNKKKTSSRNSYKIVAQNFDTAANQMFVYESDAVWFDPTDFVKETIDVLVDYKNPKKYYVDISFLPSSN